MPANPPSRASSVASVDTSSTTASHRNAALLGATTAFNRSSAQQGSHLNASASVNARNNGAVGAASLARHGSGRTSNPQPSPSRTTLPASSKPATGNSPVQGEKKETLVPLRKPTLDTSQNGRHQASPSYQAAVLASRRAKPNESTKPGLLRSETVKKPSVAPKPRRLSENFGKPVKDATDKSTDTTPIAPTTSLVHIYERRGKATSPTPQRVDPVSFNTSQDLPVKSPRPVKSNVAAGLVFAMELGETKNRTRRESTSKPDQYDDGDYLSDESFASASEVQFGHSPPPTLPGSDMRTTALHREPSKPRVEAQNPPQPLTSAGWANASKVLAGTHETRQTHRPTSAQSHVSSVSSRMSIPAQFNAANPRRMTPLRTGDELANAIVASSLASSRMPSPIRPEPPPVPHPRRKGHHHKISFSRTPSPAKIGMLQTLRKQDDSSRSEDEKHPYRKHQKRRLVRKHPNKHQEGARKRWRDAVTERERKRYEGVWAANKGLHCSLTREEQRQMQQQPGHPQDVTSSIGEVVSNLVARNIWSRSRLPSNVLETVWDLVDTSGVGRLSKEEFVIGLWLIDQRLKGRKLPTRITESIWDSVKGVGILIKK